MKIGQNSSISLKKANLRGGSTARVATFAHRTASGKNRTAQISTDNYGKRTFSGSVNGHRGSISARAVGGIAVVGAASTYGYKHRAQIKQKAATMHQGIHNSFHSTHKSLGSEVV